MSLERDGREENSKLLQVFIEALIKLGDVVLDAYLHVIIDPNANHSYLIGHCQCFKVETPMTDNDPITDK